MSNGNEMTILFDKLRSMFSQIENNGHTFRMNISEQTFQTLSDSIQDVIGVLKEFDNIIEDVLDEKVKLS